jgi:hypothetical protein
MWKLEQAGVTSMCAQLDLKFYKFGTRMPIQSKTDIISDTIKDRHHSKKTMLETNYVFYRIPDIWRKI